MKIECKFEPDEEVWVLDKKHIYEKCNICDEGKVIIKEEIFRCPKCKGVSSGVWVRAEFEVQSYFVTSIIIIKGYDYINTKYKLRHFYEHETFDEYGNTYHHEAGTFVEDELFATEEQALDECEKRNLETVEPSPWIKTKLLEL